VLTLTKVSGDFAFDREPILPTLHVPSDGIDRRHLETGIGHRFGDASLPGVS